MVRAVARTAFGALALVAMLAGCRTVPQPRIIGPGADAPWPEQVAALEKFDHYSLTGRVAVAANGQGFSGTLRYLQAGDHADLSIDGPMGLGGLRLVVDGDNVSVSTSKGDKLDGNAAREELERRLGFEMPVAQLRWWLLGIPAPGESATDDLNGVTASIRQEGWNVSIQSRAPALGFSLPQRLTIEREGARLKLLVDRWNP